MRIGVIKETAAGENRVALTPETAKKFTGLGYDVVVQSGAGVAASFPDEQYAAAGATVAPSAADALKEADLVLKVVHPPPTKRV